MDVLGCVCVCVRWKRSDRRLSLSQHFHRYHSDRCFVTIPNKGCSEASTWLFYSLILCSHYSNILWAIHAVVEFPCDVAVTQRVTGLLWSEIHLRTRTLLQPRPPSGSQMWYCLLGRWTDWLTLGPSGHISSTPRWGHRGSGTKRQISLSRFRNVTH